MSKKQPSLVSIIIPCYNYARFLPEAIESALDQTHTHVEVMVVDDGSTDDTAEVVKSFGEKIRYVYQQNQGLAAARNTGITHARGEFVVFLDADDLLDRHYLAKTIPAFETDPQIAFVYAQMEHFGRESRVTQFPEFDLETLKRWNYVNASAVIRTDVFREVTFDTSFKEGWEDWDFFLTLAERGYRGRLVDEPLLKYRKHEDAESMEDRFRDRRLNKRLLAQIYRKHRRLYGFGDTARFAVKYLILSIPGGTRVMARLGRPI